MKVVITTNIEYETRVALDNYCAETGTPLTQVIDESIQRYLREKKEGAA